MPKQALIMIDMQRGFLDSASPLCIPAAEGTVPACAALIGRCHEAGVPVIYAVRHYRADGTDVEKPRAAAWASGGKPLSEDCAAHLSDAFPDAFTVLPQDYVLVKDVYKRQAHDRGHPGRQHPARYGWHDAPVPDRAQDRPG